MSRLLPGLTLYIGATCAYGLAHAIPDAFSRKTNVYYAHGKRELLYVDRLGLIVANTVTAPMCWPVLLRSDLIRLECLARGKPVRDYLPNANDDAA
jgi:hypothetical protein